MAITFTFIPFQTKEAGEKASAKLGELMASLLLEVAEWNADHGGELYNYFDLVTGTSHEVHDTGYQIAKATNTATRIHGSAAEEEQLLAVHPNWTILKAFDSRKVWGEKAGEEGARAEQVFKEYAGRHTVAVMGGSDDGKQALKNAIDKLAAEWGEFVKDIIIEQANDESNGGYYAVSF